METGEAHGNERVAQKISEQSWIGLGFPRVFLHFTREGVRAPGA